MLGLVNFQQDSGSVKSKWTLSKRLASRQTLHLENQQTGPFSIGAGNFLCLCFGCSVWHIHSGLSLKG